MQTLIRTACKQHATLLISTITIIITLKLIVLVPPLLLGKVVDALNSNSHTSLNTLFTLTAGFALAGCIQAIVNPLQVFLLSRLVQQIVMNASIDWMAQLMRKEFCHFGSWRTGHFIKSVERGITAHEQLLTFFVTVGFPMGLKPNSRRGPNRNWYSPPV